MAYDLIKQPKVLEILEGETHYIEEDRILFLRYPWGLEPLAYECDIVVENDQLVYKGIEIEGDVSDIVFLFLSLVRRCSDRFDIDGTRLTGFLETWQWAIAIQEIKDIASLKSKDYVIADRKSVV